jgi:hypothetical protein
MGSISVENFFLSKNFLTSDSCSIFFSIFFIFYDFFYSPHKITPKKSLFEKIFRPRLTPDLHPPLKKSKFIDLSFYPGCLYYFGLHKNTQGQWSWYDFDGSEFPVCEKQ